jgi:hypothetical protein
MKTTRSPITWSHPDGMRTHLGAALIGASGALMFTAGTALPHGWATACPFILSGGLAIQAAFLLQRRATSRPAFHLMNDDRTHLSQVRCRMTILMRADSDVIMVLERRF